MPSPRSRVGRSAEILAAAELGKRGYRIIDSNYRCRAGEIDLIAEHGDCLVFVEVRCKRTNEYGTAAESITAQKRAKLLTTAQHYLMENNLDDVACRFDVVTVTAENGRLAISEVLENAFDA